METAASIIAVLQISDKVIKYIRDVSGATEERKRLREQVRACSNILMALKDEVEDYEEGEAWTKTMELIGGPLSRLQRALELAAVQLQGKSITREKLKWPFQEKETMKLVEAIENEKSLLALALQNNSARLLHEINLRSKQSDAHLIELATLLSMHVTTYKTNAKSMNAAVIAVQDVRDAVFEDLQAKRLSDEKERERQRARQVAEEDAAEDRRRREQRARELAKIRLEIIEWLSPVDHLSQQHDKISRREAGTCSWFLESETYKTWLVTTREHTLFCPGIPGAGKTIVVSAVIADLWAKYERSDDIVVAYFFCDFKRENEQSVDKILSSLLKQLVAGKAELSTTMQEFYQRFQNGRGRPLHTDILKALQNEISLHAKVFILVDALDECGVCLEILSDLFQLQSIVTFNLLATSRFVPEIVNRFNKSTSMTVHASNDDVKMYINAQMHRRAKLAKLDQKLQEEITLSIVRSVEGMFLLAKLHLDSLMGKRSTKAIRIALKKFATGSNAYDSAYTSAMQRIESQVPDQVELAKQVLAWIVHAKSQITADELQEALGVEPDEEYFDRDNCPDVDDMVSACAGLVRIDEGTNTIQLVHYTTQEYFERTRHNWFPYAEAMIATTCMAYLSLDQFETLSGLELYKYASLFWGLHARSAQDTLAQVMKFLQRSVQVEQNGDFIHRHHNVELGGTADRKVRRTTALHLAAYFGLEEVAGTFDDLSTYDQSNSEGVTPIMYAAMRNHESVLKLLLARDTSLQCSHAGISPLYLAAYNGHLAIVHLLLGHDPPGQAEDGVNDPLVGAARNGHESIVKLLVKRYVWPSARDTRVLCALLYAARAGHDSTAEYLFETGPGNFVNFAKALESTHLHQAAEQEFKNVLQLLRKGSKQSKSRTTNISTSQESANLLRNLLESDVPSVEFMGDDDGLGTPMRQAAAKGRLGMGKALIELGAEINDQSSTALWLAVEGGYDDFIDLLWEHCGDVSIRHVMFQRVLCGALCQKSVYSRAVKALVGTGIDLSRQFYGETAIQIAFRRGHLDAAKVLLEAGVNVDQQDADNGQTLLFTMTLLENRAGVKLLASGGANPNLCNMHGRSPLHVAAKHHKFGYLTIIESLVKAGAELDKRDDWGTTPLHLGCRFRSYGCEKIVKFLLDAGADVNHQDDLGQSPLHMACTNGHTKLVKLLLDHGANVRCSDKHGNTPLHVACRWEDGVPVKMVLDSGSDVSCRIRLGDSPLHQGRWESHEAVVRMLLDAGANVTSQDSKGSTALDDARDQGHGDIVKLLLERGVNEECPARAVKTLPVRLKSDELRHTTTPVSEVLTT